MKWINVLRIFQNNNNTHSHDIGSQNTLIPYSPARACPSLHQKKKELAIRALTQAHSLEKRVMSWQTLYQKKKVISWKITWKISKKIPNMEGRGKDTLLLSSISDLFPTRILLTLSAAHCYGSNSWCLFIVKRKPRK